MKGVPGLIVSVVLGLVGAFCGWFYLNQEAKQMEMIEFIGIADDVRINPGDKFKDIHFMKISIPRSNVGNLDASAPKFSELNTVVGKSANRSHVTGEILLYQDLRTAPSMTLAELLGESEVARSITVDTRTFVPPLVVAGRDFVSFIIPGPTRSVPTPLAADGSGGAPAGGGAASPADLEVVGPFRVIGLGNRLGSSETLRAAGVSQVQESVMTIGLKFENNKFDDMGRKLEAAVQRIGNQPLGVLVHSSKTK
jgi:hypothetical protein